MCAQTVGKKKKIKKKSEFESVHVQIESVLQVTYTKSEHKVNCLPSWYKVIPKRKQQQQQQQQKLLLPLAVLCSPTTDTSVTFSVV